MTPRAVQPANYYVALGSSFAAGPGIRPRAHPAPRGSGRSARNYAHLLAERRGLRLIDVSYSGATSADLIRISAKGTPAQIAAIDQHTSLVTITAGGNDVGYLPALTLGSLPFRVRNLPALRLRIDDYLDPDATIERLVALHERLSETVTAIHDRAPRAAVHIVDYLRILPDRLQRAPGIPPDRILSWARTTSESLTRTFRTVAEATDACFIDTAAASRDHHAWAQEPWVRSFHYTLHNGAPYHPNAAGMTAVAELLDAALE